MVTYLLVIVDLLQVIVELTIKASGSKLLLCVVGDSLAIELAFEVLEGESIVQDGDVSTRWGIVVCLLDESWHSTGRASYKSSEE